MTGATAHFEDGRVQPVLDGPDGPSVYQDGRLWALNDGLPDLGWIGEGTTIVSAPRGLTAVFEDGHRRPLLAVEVDPSSDLGFVWVAGDDGSLVRACDVGPFHVEATADASSDAGGRA